MKSINQYIQEKLIIKKKEYKYFPKTKEDLIDIVDKRIHEEGNEVNLNNIDTSEITDMSSLFYLKTDFNGDISNWDVSNVISMYGTFYGCELFNQDLSNWDVSNVDNYQYIFDDCKIEEKYKPKFK